MKSLFRSIRQKLLNEGKLFRYLTYALGEIVLIVVGILFALKINDWNEDRKAEAEFNLYVELLKADVANVVSQNREIAEFNREHAINLYTIVLFLEQTDHTEEGLIEFEQGLRDLGRHRLMQLDVGCLGEMLDGNTEVISRDHNLHQESMRVISEIKVFQDIISSMEPVIAEERSKLSRFRGLDSRRRIPEMPLRYDLDELRNSEEFVNVTQSLIVVQINMAGFLEAITNKLEEYLSVLEEYE